MDFDRFSNYSHSFEYTPDFSLREHLYNGTIGQPPVYNIFSEVSHPVPETSQTLMTVK